MNEDMIIRMLAKEREQKENKIIDKLHKHKLWLEGHPDGVRANLKGVELPCFYLCKYNLSKARLGDANLSRANMSYTVLEGAILIGANLRKANLFCSKMANANLGGADLRSANLRNADFTNANLRGANLLHADLRGANLDGAILDGAILRKARLEGAKITDTTSLGCDAYFAAIRGQPIYQTVCGCGLYNHTITLYAKGSDESRWKFFTESFQGTREEFVAMIQREYYRESMHNKYLLAINYLMDIARENNR